MNIALLSNPNSGRNKYLSKINELVESTSSIRHFHAKDTEQFKQFIEQIKQNPVDLVAINAGDGTVQALLTLMFNRLDEMPILAVLRGGTTNMTAGDVGVKGSCVTGIKKLIAWSSKPNQVTQTQTRPVLKIEWDDPSSPVCGMFFGAGAIIEGQDYFHSNISKKGLRDSIGPALSALRIIFALNNQQQSIFTPTSMQISGWDKGISIAKNAPPTLASSGKHLLAFASALEHLFLGIHPFWGSNNGLLYFTAVRHQPRGYSLLGLLPLFRGKPGRDMTPEKGFLSAKLDRAEIQLDGQFTVDGERYSTNTNNQSITISHAGDVQFLQL